MSFTRALKASQGLIQPNLYFGRRWESKALFKQEMLLLYLCMKIYTRSYAERLSFGQQKIRYFFSTRYNLPYRHVLGQKIFCSKGDGQSFLLLVCCVDCKNQFNEEKFKYINIYTRNRQKICTQYSVSKLSLKPLTPIKNWVKVLNE